MAAPVSASSAVDADPACSQELIHVPGAIQPHGALLAVDPLRGWTVVAASRNAAGLLASPSTGRVIGRSVASLLGQPFADAVQRRFQGNTLRGQAPWQSTLELTGAPPAFDVAVHSHAGLVLVELEPADAEADTEAKAVIRQLQQIIVGLRETGSDLDELALVTARGVRLLTGYERVVIYRFDSDWNGQGIVEDKVAGWDNSLNGLRFPASDIPAQARELYRHSPMRWVPDRDAAPVPLDVDPAWDPAQPSARTEDAPPQAIDLSFAHLRSLSPVHMQIHRNLGINGSMSLSILHRDRLWGLMVCHHRQPHHPSANRRLAASALTDAFALRVGPAEHIATEQARREDVVRLSALLAHMAEADDVTAALTTGGITVNSLFASTGAAVLFDGAVSLLGHTPPEADVREAAAWLRTQDSPARLFQTNNICAAFPSWSRHTAIASGLLAVFLSDDRANMLLWFRPEEAELVTWGGSSHSGAGGGAPSLPKHSYEKWTELRHGLARPWAEWELEMAETLRHGIADVMVRSLRRIADLNDRLRQSQKMEAVGQLTGGIAHDFNNLLAGILGSLELMRVRVGQGRIGDLDRYIGLAMTSANRAASLTHRLLAFSRRQTLDPQSVDVNQLAASMEDLIRRTVGPSIRVETMTLGGLWRTLCDANQLENALLNLAINARDAMPEGGHLTIEGANVTLDEADAGRHEIASGQYVVVSVTDTGCGMAPDVIARVFEPFFTTKPLGQGTGLGLSMVYGFAKQSNGNTGIHSEVGVGTTVRLYLPRSAETGKVEAGNPEPAPNTAGRAEGTVLVVDDEAAVRVLVGDVLRDLGYEVIEAVDGLEGLRVLQSKRRIDLLVSDVGLPGGMNGRQLADAARVQRPQLKVLFITGFAESAAWGSKKLEPNMQVLAKPFALDVLTATVEAMLC
ncbi:MAG TPA: ATP-binding protein [Acetobacteraceae bacterium]